MARASRVRNDLSSSTISSVRSPGIGAGAAISVMVIIISALPTLLRIAMRPGSTAQEACCCTSMSGRAQRTRTTAPCSGACLLKNVTAAPGALQQRFGDEEAEAQAALLAFGADAAAAGHIRLADAPQDFRREARSIIGDRDRDILLAPAHRDFDTCRREVDGVFHDVAEPIEDRGRTLHHRLAVALGRQHNVDRDAEMAVRGRDLFDQRQKIWRARMAHLPPAARRVCS